MPNLVVRQPNGAEMNTTLRWIKFEAIMIAILPVKGISALKLNSFEDNPISRLDIS
jgi:hypothetical protein